MHKARLDNTRSGKQWQAQKRLRIQKALQASKQLPHRTEPCQLVPSVIPGSIPRMHAVLVQIIMAAAKPEHDEEKFHAKAGRSVTR